MEGNSIKDNLSKADIISDIQLSLGADVHREQVFLVVEGEDDIKFLRSFLSDNVSIYESYDGKNGVEYIVSNHFSNDKRVVGIRDRDYQVTPISHKIFYYDYGCMEMMLIRNDIVFKKIYAEFYRGEIACEQLRFNILKELKIMSVIRMLNEQNDWGKTLRGISLNNAWNSIEKKIEKSAILSKFDSINSGFLSEEILHIIEEKYIDEWTEEDFYKYTQGHDFSTLLAAICNQYTRKGVKHTEIESNCRCVFRNEDFIETELYRKIDDYEQQYCVKICSI